MQTPIAEFDHVSVRYPATASRSRTAAPADVLALDDVSAHIDAAEVVGIVGESGAGKSTMLRLFNGMEHPTSGTVRIEGTNLADLSSRALSRVRHRIGMVFQSFNLLSNRTVAQNVALPLALQHRRDDARVSELLQFVGLDHRADTYPAQLSGGQRQRVAIARALVTRPSILLADEPTSALDARTTDEILRLLAAARDDFGTAIVLVTHELAAVKAICDRALLLDEGRLIDTIPVTREVRDTDQSYIERAREELHG